MAGPWEKYQQQGPPASAAPEPAPAAAEAGPWTKYQGSAPTPAKPEPDFAEQVSQKAVRGFVKAGRLVDSVTGSPMRAAIGAGMNGENPISAFASQWGSEPELAPTGRELATKMGFSEDKSIPTPFIQPGGKKISLAPAQVAGTGIDILADPTIAISPFKAVGAVAKGATRAVGAVAREGIRGAGMVTKAVMGAEFAAKARNKLASALSNIPEEKIARYMERPPERVAHAPSTHDTKDQIDMMVRSLEMVKDDAKNAVDVAAKNLDEGYRQGLADLHTKAVPTSVADAATGKITEIKQSLGALSEQADDALARTPGFVEKQHIQEFLAKVAGSVNVGDSKVVVGDAANAAVSKLHALDQRIASLPDQIDHVTLRDILRQVREDINFTQSAGEKNSVLDRMRKEFTHGVSDVLKTRSDEYKKIVERMKTLSDSVDELDPFFGTRERSLASLESITGNTKGRSQIAKEALDRFSALTGDDSIQKALVQHQEAKRIIGEARIKDVRAQIAPQAHADYEKAVKELAEADAAFEPVRHLGDRRTENLSGGNRKLSIEDKKSLEYLEKLFGTPIVQNIEDRGLDDMFKKDAGRGSRYQVAGAAAGGAIGSVLGPGGAAVGAGLGGLAGLGVEKNAGAITRRLLDSTRNVRLPSKPSTQSIGDALKEIRSYTPVEQGGKGAQIYSTQDLLGNAEERRTAIRRRLEKGKVAE